MTRIDQLMTRTVYTCRRDTSILQAAEAMEEHDVGALPVYEDGQLLGIVTDRDIVVRAVAQGLLRTRVEFIMSTEVATCHEDEEVAEVLERMRARQLRRMPVLQRDDDQLIGMVSLADLAHHADAWTVSNTLEGISRPAPLDLRAERPPTGLAL